MAIYNRLRYFVFFIGFVLILPLICSYILSNIAYIQQNHAVGSAASYPFFEKANSFFPNNRSAQRGRALNYFFQGSFDESFALWQKTNVTVQDLIVYANEAARKNDWQLAVNWLLLAERLDSEDAKLWHTIGTVCQNDPQLDSICERFLRENEQNWLLNSDFLFHRDGWHVKRVDGFDVDYLVVDCPERDGLCGYIGAKTAVPTHGLSWSQCVFVEPEQTYTFSAWIKVDVAPNGAWRPIYFQGKQNSQNHGIGIAEQQGAAAWQFWENTFTMPEFDDSRACFHPIRLLSTGEAWFSDATLRVHPSVP